MDKSFEAILEPLISMCQFDADAAIAQQEELLAKLHAIQTDLMRINENHFHNKDQQITKYLDKVISQSGKVELLTSKLESMQKRVQAVENTFKRLKEDIPELKKNFLLGQDKK